MELWIARDKNGTLKLWFNKPVKQKYQFYNNDGFFILDEKLFPEVTFENSPQKVKLELIKE